MECPKDAGADSRMVERAGRDEAGGAQAIERSRDARYGGTRRSNLNGEFQHNINGLPQLDASRATSVGKFASYI